MKARLLRTGVPIGLTIVAEAGMFIAVTFLIGLFSTAALAAAAIAMSVLRGVNNTRIPAIVTITSFRISGVAVRALAGFPLASARPASGAGCCLDSAWPR